MSNLELQDILKAERDAAERVQRAHKRAEEITQEARKRIEELDREVNARIDAKRRERTERVQAEIAQAHKAAIAEADAAIAGWEARYNQRREAIIARIVDILTGKKEA